MSSVYTPPFVFANTDDTYDLDTDTITSITTKTLHPSLQILMPMGLIDPTD